MFWRRYLSIYFSFERKASYPGFSCFVKFYSVPMSSHDELHKQLHACMHHDHATHVYVHGHVHALLYRGILPDRVHTHGGGSRLWCSRIKAGSYAVKFER